MQPSDAAVQDRGLKDDTALASENPATMPLNDPRCNHKPAKATEASLALRLLGYHRRGLHRTQRETVKAHKHNDTDAAT